MAIVSGGGGGGTFNGGTITSEMQITPAAVGVAGAVLTLTSFDGSEGGLTILSPDDASAGSAALFVQAGTSPTPAAQAMVDFADNAFNDVFVIYNNGDSEICKLGPTAKLGFYGHATTALQTGVPVTAAGIHAALVALGLITA